MRLRIVIGITSALVLAAGGIALSLGLPASGKQPGQNRQRHSRPGWHSQDQARHRDHAGEQVVRFYFGTFPGVTGIPKNACLPDPLHGGCVKPFVDHKDSNAGGPHQNPNSISDVDGGKMDGFVGKAELKCEREAPLPDGCHGAPHGF